MTRIVTDAEIKTYEKLVNKYLRDNVVKNWNEATLATGQDEVTLGNTGMSVADIRQQLLTEVVVALQKYNPDYRTKVRYKKDDAGNIVNDENGEPIVADPGGRSVKEFTFVYQHLFNRCGQLMKKLTKRRYGYGIWSNELSTILHENETVE